MRKAINSFTLLFFTWLILDAFNVPNNLMLFLMVGEIPGTNISLSPTTMLSLMTLCGGILLFEFLARRIEIVRRIRQHLVTIVSRRERLPRRRFSRALS